jgi:dihydrofolate synthase/folylpolyglutamate synthase
MTYSEAIQFLYSLRMFGAKFGLENTLELAAFVGNPQEKLRFIHVAGTNGKGSTCAMLESIYRSAGLRVGLFTSPHLVSFSERMQVDRKLISDSDVIRLVMEMQSVLKHFPETEHPTFFEVVTVMALKYFAEEKCELVIWETGLGGRLDATNIVTPLASVITNVQYDHQKWLGDTLSQIASEKAGIIKPGIPVLTTAEEPEALRVIRETAQKNQARLTEVAPETLDPRIALPLLGEYQRSNASLAVATVRALSDQIIVSEEQIRRGLETVFWPGRLQLFKRGSQTFLLDGAHNPAGVETLTKTVGKTFSEHPALVVGMLGDKNWQAMCQMLATLGGTIFAVPVQTDRTVKPIDMVEAFKPAHVIACTSLAEALERSRNESFVVITGSLYLIGEAMELLGLSPARNERGLNEWQPGASKKS